MKKIGLYINGNGLQLTNTISSDVKVDFFFFEERIKQYLHILNLEF